METLKSWVAERLRQRGRGARKELAAKLGRAPSAVTRLTSDDERVEFTYREIALIAEFFGELPPVELLLPWLGETKLRAEAVQMATSLTEEQAAALIPLLRQVVKP